jgi:hypothetical protein
LRVDDLLRATDSALCRVVEGGARGADRDVPLENGRQPDAAVVIGVLLATDSEHPDIEEAHRTREHPLAAQLLAFEVRGDAAPQRRQ